MEMYSKKQNVEINVGNLYLLQIFFNSLVTVDFVIVGFKVLL